MDKMKPRYISQGEDWGVVVYPNGEGFILDLKKPIPLGRKDFNYKQRSIIAQFLGFYPDKIGYVPADDEIVYEGVKIEGEKHIEIKGTLSSGFIEGIEDLNGGFSRKPILDAIADIQSNGKLSELFEKNHIELGL